MLFALSLPTTPSRRMKHVDRHVRADAQLDRRTKFRASARRPASIASRNTWRAPCPIRRAAPIEHHRRHVHRADAKPLQQARHGVVVVDVGVREHDAVDPHDAAVPQVGGDRLRGKLRRAERAGVVQQRFARRAFQARTHAPCPTATNEHSQLVARAGRPGQRRHQADEDPRTRAPPATAARRAPVPKSSPRTAPHRTRAPTTTPAPAPKNARPARDSAQSTTCTNPPSDTLAHPARSDGNERHKPSASRA